MPYLSFCFLTEILSARSVQSTTCTLVIVENSRQYLLCHMANICLFCGDSVLYAMATYSPEDFKKFWSRAGFLNLHSHSGQSMEMRLIFIFFSYASKIIAFTFHFNPVKITSFVLHDGKILVKCWSLVLKWRQERKGILELQKRKWRWGALGSRR